MNQKSEIYLRIMDKSFPNFREIGEFDLENALDKNSANELNILRESESGVFSSPLVMVADLLNANGYAIVKYKGNSCIVELTEKGKSAKMAGGHFAYLKKVGSEGQIINYDLKIKKVAYRTWYLPYLISLAALVVSILSYINSNKNKQTEKPTERIEIRPQTIQNSLNPADTSSRKERNK